MGESARKGSETMTDEQLLRRLKAQQPDALEELMGKYRRVVYITVAGVLGKAGTPPDVEEIAQELHMTVEEASSVQSMLEDARMLARVNSRQQEQEEEEKEAQDQAVEDTAQFRMRQRILDLLSNVSEEDAKLLTLRFGLEGGKPLSPQEAGKRLGLTPDEVLTREAAALAKLRNG